MTPSENFVKRLPNDIGGLPADPIDCKDHELQPWEKRCHALADVLDFHKILNTEEKRRGVEALAPSSLGSSPITSAGLPHSPTSCSKNKFLPRKNWRSRWTRWRLVTLARPKD